MRVSLMDWFCRLADVPAVRRALDVVFAARSRLHLVWLGRLDPARAQWRTLSRLVHKAARTPFGLDHDLARIRTEADFQRLVPLRTPQELVRSYSQPGSMWPDAAGTDLMALHRRGLRSALSLAAQARGGLFAGAVSWLGDNLPIADPAEAMRQRLPRLLRAAVSPPGHGPASLVIGAVGRVMDALLANPSPRAILAWKQSEADSVDEVRRRLPGSVVIEMLVRPEGTLAVESPRHGRFRLLPEHGAFFEFVPLARPGERLTLSEARVGEAYELAVTTPAAWACRTGLGVCFDRLTPPLFHLVPLPRTEPMVAAPRKGEAVAGGLAEMFAGRPARVVRR